MTAKHEHKSAKLVPLVAKYVVHSVEAPIPDSIPSIDSDDLPTEHQKKLDEWISTSELGTSEVEFYANVRNLYVYLASAIDFLPGPKHP